MKKNLIIGNWKMNNNLQQALALTSEVSNMLNTEHTKNTEVVLAPPLPYLYPINKLIESNNKVVLAAQNCNENEFGAFTGEVSPPMLKSLNVKYVIIGHSERRLLYNESNKLLSKKIDLTLKNNMQPVFCCGEPLDVRNANTYYEYINKQIEDSLFHLDNNQFSKIIIAYEPIWAIGTGQTASKEQVQDVHAEIRKLIKKKYNTTTSIQTTILYGGSVKPNNARELFSCPDIDGGLIGGASLNARDFINIVQAT